MEVVERRPGDGDDLELDLEKLALAFVEEIDPESG